MEGYDPVWNELHSKRELGKYPPEELIRFVAKYYYDCSDRKSVRFLDVGCGQGSSTWYLCREGFFVTAIDGSKPAIEKAKRRLENEGLMAEFVLGDVIKLPFDDCTFDCAIDIYSLMCCSKESTKEIVKEVSRVLKPGGRFLSCSAQTGPWGENLGVMLDDKTYVNVESGPYANIGTIRFMSEDDIEDLYAPFVPMKVDYCKRSWNDYELGLWVLHGQKR